MLQCPGAPELEYGYALNEAVAGLDVRSLPNHESTVLVLPSVKGVRNEVRPIPAAVEGGRHGHLPGYGEAPKVAVGLLSGGVGCAMEGRPYAEFR